MLDKVSGTANKITARIDTLFHHAQAGMQKTIGGGAGLIGVGLALRSMLSPAIEMDRALGEVESLGVMDAGLRNLEATALRTAIRYGGSATEIVQASYDIQSAISGLSANELARFTEVSAILAKGTKSDATTITDFMGTMYGIFQNTANRIGKSDWVAQLAGQTATAVQMFKTTGGEMAASFVSLGAEAETHGVAMAEQIAILGTLQATMSGSEAGTKYKAFLNSVGKGQDVLGLKFTDSLGRMLPMVDILQTLQGKFGHIDTVAKSDLLKKAFGTKEAVGLIKLLLQNTDSLGKSIATLGDISGMEKAAEMAATMADPWERLSAAGIATKTVFGRVMQPVLVPLINTLISGGESIIRWTELFPNLTRVVGVAILVILGLIATVSTFALIGGLAQLSLAGFHAVLAIGTGFVAAYGLVIKIASGAMTLFRAVALAGAINMGVLSSSLGLSTVATWGFNTALFANPIVWIIAGVIGLIAALVLLTMHWETVTRAVGDFVTNAIQWFVEKWQWMRGIIENNLFMTGLFTPLLVGVTVIDTLINAFEQLPQWWQRFSAWLATLNPFSAVLSGIDGLIEKINIMPGISIDSSLDISENIAKEKAALQSSAPSLDTARSDNVPIGGLQSIFNNDRGTRVDKVEVHTTGSVDGFQLADELRLAGG